MRDFVASFTDAWRDIGPRDVIDVLCIAALIFVGLYLLRGTTAMSLLRGGFLSLAAVKLVAAVFDLQVLNWLVDSAFPGLVVIAVIVLQPELRRMLERVGRTRVPALRTRQPTDAVIDAVARVCSSLSSLGFGALIVFERETGLETFIATGRRLDALVSEELLGNIFFKNSPLHDGAVIIRSDRIVAAACRLPLTDEHLEGHAGTRHRAGIGVTEGTDAVSVIVSEETGDISLAANGRLASQLDDARLRGLLADLLGQEGGGPPDSEARPRPEYQAVGVADSEVAG